MELFSCGELSQPFVALATPCRVYLLGINSLIDWVQLLSLEDQKSFRLEQLFSSRQNEELFTKFATEKEMSLSKLASWLKLWKEVKRNEQTNQKASPSWSSRSRAQANAKPTGGEVVETVSRDSRTISKSTSSRFRVSHLSPSLHRMVEQVVIIPHVMWGKRMIASTHLTIMDELVRICAASLEE